MPSKNIELKFVPTIPEGAKDNDAFYLTPLCKKPADPCKSWYKNTPVGRNHLNSMMKKTCKHTEVDRSFTNQSLRAYGTTKMFQARIPEKLIQQCTGHRSLEGLCCYGCKSVSQLNVLSNDLVPPPSTVTSTSAISENPTSIVFKGCTFARCVISMSGQATNENHYENGIKDLLQGIDGSDILGLTALLICFVHCTL